MKEYFAQNQASDILQKLNLERLSGGKTCDIQLKCGEEKFHAHKIVLSQVSEYLLFYSEMKEKYQDSVELDSIEGKTLKTILDFVYTAKITFSTDDVFDILTAANYLLIQPIQEFCCNFILETLDFNNSVQVWLKVQKFDIDKGCDEYLKENFTKLTDTVTTNSMDFSTFKTFIATRSQDAKSEEKVFQFTVGWVKHDLEARKHLFPQLFELIDLKLLSHEFFSYDVGFEDLVQESNECLQRFSKHVKYFTGPRASSSIFALNKNSTILTMVDTKENAKRDIATMVEVRQESSFVMYKNYLYMVGGLIDRKISNSVTRLDLRCQYKGWEVQPSMVRKRRTAGVAVIGDVMFVFGGNPVGGRNTWFVPEKLKLDDKESKWVEMKMCKMGLDLVACKGMLYGLNYSFLEGGTCEKYDPVTQTSTLMHKLPDGCEKLVEMKDQLYAICQTSHGVGHNTFQLSKYDPESGESTHVSKIVKYGQFRDACAAHGEIVVSYVRHWICPVVPVCIDAYNFDDKKWRLVTESKDTSDYCKLVSYKNNPFE